MSTPQNRYEVLESLGTGATSRVDKARDTVIGRTVALKTLLRGFGSRDLQQQFLREAQIIGGLSHPHIVALFDVGTNSEGAPYFVMEYVEGKTLECFFDAGPLPIARAAVWAGDLASALGQAHRANVIHGDVKPANILVTLDQQVKLGDFGIARFSTQASGSGNLMGTPAYLSPEQILGNLQDGRSDLFSLGVVLYQMSTGKRPFDGDSVEAVCAQIISSAPLPPSHHNPSLPTSFDQVVLRCLSKNPGDRFPTAESFAASVYPFARNTESTPLHSSSNSSVAKRPNLTWWNRPFRQKELWTVAAVLLLLIAGASIVSALRKHAIPSPAASAATVDRPVVTAAPSAPSPSISIAATSLIPSETTASPSADASSASMKPESQPPHISTPLTSKISPRAKSSTPEQHRSDLTTGPALRAQLGQPLAVAPSSSAQVRSPKQLASLSVEIVSAVAEETLAVYSGQDLLISTRLDAAHLGESLHFDCPLSTGAHPLRVVLYRADESLHVQKEGFAEIVSDGSNILDIRIDRRSKFLIHKEATLEVSWPNPRAAAEGKFSSQLAAVSTPSK
ncbi:MAG TPA: serine/threonine-protein kinase [Candidatus Acidoferrum sp.]|nr:serine/threonine-protein kinase [Candidatus Acidoferrum sp.]